MGNRAIRGCVACRKCHETGKCVFDDAVNEVAPKLKEADAFVIGAPVYFASPAGGAISFMDRLFFSTLADDKTTKVGAAVTTCRRGGNTASFDVLNKYFTMTGMPVASSQYWNMVYGGSADEVKLDAEGLQTMRTLDHIAAIVAIEPGGAPGADSEDFQAVLDKKIPVTMYFGDYIDNGDPAIQATGMWQMMRQACYAFRDAYNERGGNCTVVDLPQEGITGNDHFMFQDLNNDVIAAHVENWIQKNVEQ